MAIKIDDANLRTEIEQWTTANTFPDVIRFLRSGFDYIVGDSVLQDSAYDAIGIISGEEQSVKDALMLNDAADSIRYVNQNNIVFDGEGQTFRNLYLENCTNVTLINFTLSWGVSSIISCSAVVIDNAQLIDLEGSHFIRIRGTCDNILISNSLFKRTNLAHFADEHCAIQLKGESVTNVVVEYNTFVNIGDSVAATQIPDVTSDISGLIVRHNSMTVEPAWQGGCENAVDLKLGALDPENPILIHDNIMSGYQPSDTSAGDAILLHIQCKNVQVYDNIITDCLYKLSVKPLQVDWEFLDRNIYLDGVHINMAGQNVTQHIS